MKVKLICDKDKREQIEDMLIKGGFEISEQGEYQFIEKGFAISSLVGLDEDKSQCIVELTDILYIDSFGRDIIIHTIEGVLKINDTLENLERQLPQTDFLRISKSTIIRRFAIKKISPSFQMRFKLIMKNGDAVYVTRSYYYDFINFMDL